MAVADSFGESPASFAASPLEKHLSSRAIVFPRPGPWPFSISFSNSPQRRIARARIRIAVFSISSSWLCRA